MSAYDEIDAVVKRGNYGVRDELMPLIQNELDTEALLKKTLGYMLQKIGPTNIALFLPKATGEWVLGAYARSNNRRGSVRSTDTSTGIKWHDDYYNPETFKADLQHLAEIQIPRMELYKHGFHIRGGDTESQITDRFCGEADWLVGSEVVFCNYNADGEILASILVFRSPGDCHAGGGMSLGLVEAIMEVFAEQLKKIMHAHSHHASQDGCDTSVDTEGNGDDDHTPPGGNWPGGHLGGRDGR